MYTLTMGKREENKEVTYLDDETQNRLLRFVRDNPDISKSRTIEKALQFYFKMVDRYGLVHGWWPRIDHEDVSRAAESQRPYAVERKPLKKRAN